MSTWYFAWRHPAHVLQLSWTQLHQQSWHTEQSAAVQRRHSVAGKSWVPLLSLSSSPAVAGQTSWSSWRPCLVRMHSCRYAHVARRKHTGGELRRCAAALCFLAVLSAVMACVCVCVLCRACATREAHIPTTPPLCPHHQQAIGPPQSEEGGEAVLQLAQAVLAVSGWLQPPHLAACAAALSRAGLSQPELWEALAAVAEPKIGGCSFAQLAILLEAMAVAGCALAVALLEGGGGAAALHPACRRRRREKKKKRAPAQHRCCHHPTCCCCCCC